MKLLLELSVSIKKKIEPENWYFYTEVLEKTLESPLDCKKTQPVHPKGNPPWIFIGRSDAEAEAPVLWPPGVKSWLIWKDPDAGKYGGQEEKRATKDEMVGWHHWLGCLFVLRLLWFLSQAGSTPTTSTFWKTHDGSAEILLSILPCTQKFNYTRLWYAKQKTWRFKRTQYYRFYTNKKKITCRLNLVILTLFLNHQGLANSTQ